VPLLYHQSLGKLKTCSVWQCDGDYIIVLGTQLVCERYGGLCSASRPLIGSFHPLGWIP